MLRGALAALLALEPDFDVVGSADNGVTAYEMLAGLKPDVLLTDIEMPLMTGIELAEKIQANHLNVKVVMLTTFARSGYLRRAMDAGVCGYMLKDAPSDELADGLRKVMQGRKVIDPDLVIDAFDTKDPLTDKERKALKLAGDGLTTDSIAQAMFLSPGTVRNYLSNAASKLGAKNRVEAARIARQQGWL